MFRSLEICNHSFVRVFPCVLYVWSTHPPLFSPLITLDEKCILRCSSLCTFLHHPFYLS
jgi:hypothetical protein